MKSYKIVLIFFVVLLQLNCTKLEEEFRDRIVPTAGVGTDNPTTLLQGAYNAMNGPFQDQATWWAAAQHTTDETIGPTRGPDWDDNGVWRVLHNHRWDADHIFLNNTFVGLQQVQYAGTAVLDANPSPQQAAEARFIRAFAMYITLDGWDQVPFRETTKGDVVHTLPTVKKGTAAADFIIAELTAALAGLPTSPKNKANRDGAKVLMMKAYLNKGVFGNRQSPTFAAGDMNQVITLADQIISSGAYTFAANYFDNFAPNNSTNVNEIIYALENTNSTGRGGNNQSMWFLGLHYNQNPSGWNGFTTLGDFYDKFTATDTRRGGAYPGVTNVAGLRVGFLFGQQYGDAAQTIALQDRRGNALSFTKEVKLKETGNNLEITGIRVMKYPPDYAANWPSNNDWVIYRYADVLLMKAEAILRGGTATGAAPYNSALNLVNFIRVNRGAAPLASVDLNALLDERGRELYWEALRRNDLIRFGKFLNAWQEKPASGPERLLFPIPNPQLAANPNLAQNPGY